MHFDIVIFFVRHLLKKEQHVKGLGTQIVSSLKNMTLTYPLQSLLTKLSYNKFHPQKNGAN